MVCGSIPGAAALKGGDTGPAIVPGKPKESLLIDAINYGELYQMPPKSKLPAEEIAALTKWVELGAPWPDADSHGRPSCHERVRPGQTQSRALVLAADRRARLPPLRTPKSRLRNPIDAFILAKLEERGSPLPRPPTSGR